MKSELFTAEDDTLEEEDVVFAVDVGFCHNENIFEQKFTEVGDVMSLPVLDSDLEIPNGLHILSPSLSLVNLVCDTFCGRTSPLEFIIVRIVDRRGDFQQRLARA